MIGLPYFDSTPLFIVLGGRDKFSRGGRGGRGGFRRWKYSLSFVTDASMASLQQKTRDAQFQVGAEG